jgi:hypothetical protein
MMRKQKRSEMTKVRIEKTQQNILSEIRRRKQPTNSNMSSNERTPNRSPGTTTVPIEYRRRGRGVVVEVDIPSFHSTSDGSRYDILFAVALPETGTRELNPSRKLKRAGVVNGTNYMFAYLHTNQFLCLSVSSRWLLQRMLSKISSVWFVVGGGGGS